MRQVYLGVDFHSTKTVTHRIERTNDGRLVRTNKTYYTEELPQLINTLDKDTYVCIEASAGVFTFCEMMQESVKELVVIHPNGFRRMYLSGKKTDKVDAKQLADRMKAHIEDDDSSDDFPSVWIPPKPIRELREMFSCLELLKKQITMQKNKIRSILRQQMIMLAEEETLEITSVDELNIPESSRWMIRQLQTLLCSTLTAKKELEARIKQAAVKHDEATMRVLVTVYGVSVMGAAAVLSDAGCIERFKSAKKFSRYMRSAPRVDSSNETTRIGSIDKAGRKTAFGYLIEGLLNITRGNPHFQDFAERKTVGKSKCKVRAALVRKTITTIFYMWKNHEVYRFEHDEVTFRKLKEVERIKKSIQAA